MSGLHVVTAASVDAALGAIATERPSIIISDIGMPGADGYELMRALRAKVPRGGAFIPAIALTAYAREEDRRLALAAGFQAHIAKPVDPATLSRIVARVLHPTDSVFVDE
jgi:CheY-like chemotaxis protein